MARAKTGRRRLHGLAFAALVLAAGCSAPQHHQPAENEFNAWADHVEQERATGQANAPVDLEEPANVMDRAPANTR